MLGREGAQGRVTVVGSSVHDASAIMHAVETTKMARCCVSARCGSDYTGFLCIAGSNPPIGLARETAHETPRETPQETPQETSYETFRMCFSRSLLQSEHRQTQRNTIYCGKRSPESAERCYCVMDPHQTPTCRHFPLSACRYSMQNYQT